MIKTAILQGGPYDGTTGEIGKVKDVLYFPETGGFAYVLTTEQPLDAPVLVYRFSERMSPAIEHAKRVGAWEPTPEEAMN